jgi:hypothetical protein
VDYDSVSFDVRFLALVAVVKKRFALVRGGSGGQRIA